MVTTMMSRHEIVCVAMKNTTPSTAVATPIQAAIHCALLLIRSVNRKPRRDLDTAPSLSASAPWNGVALAQHLLVCGSLLLLPLCAKLLVSTGAFKPLF